MNSVFKYLVIIFIILISKNIYSASFEEAQEIIDIRKTTMQELWLRVKRLSPYVELKEKGDYNKDIASNDAQEIILLLEKAKDLWPSTLTYQEKLSLMQHLQYGLCLHILENFILLLKSQQLA